MRRAEGQGGGRLGLDRPAARPRPGIWMMTLAVAAVWLGMLTLPGVGPMLGMALAWMLAAMAILGAAMGLGWLGFRLFAAFDRLAGWSGREPEWFHPDPPGDPGPGR